MVTGETQISFALIISVVSIGFVIYNAYRGSKQDKQNDIDVELKRMIETKENFVKVNMKLDELCRGNQAIQILLDKQSNDLKEMSKEVSKNSNNIQTLFRYKDESFDRIEKLENKIK